MDLNQRTSPQLNDSVIQRLRCQLAKVDAKLASTATSEPAGDRISMNPLPGLVLTADEAAEALQWLRDKSGSVELRERERSSFEKRLGLSDDEVFCLHLGLAPELDRRYEIIFAFLQDDITQRRPTVNLASQLLFNDSLKSRLRAHKLFAAQGRLRRLGLIELFDPTEAGQATLLGHSFRLTPPLVAYFLNERVKDQPVPRTKVMSPEIARALELVGEEPVLFRVNCRRPYQARDFANGVAERLGLAIGESDKLMESMLQARAFFLDGGTDVDWDLWLEMAAASANVAFLHNCTPPYIEPPWTLIDVDLPSVGRQAGKIELTPEQSARARQITDGHAAWREDAISASDADRAVRQVAGEELSSLRLGARIEPAADLSRLVLPSAARQLVDDLCAMVRSWPKLFEQWGFQDVITGGRGISALFYGPPGTGKTFGAEAVAAELGLDLYKVDLSQVVNKYIGETEKQLARLFDVAERTGTVLFFDEADALFGKRTELKDAHDRFANIEVAYLLQRMEEYEGISILATNLRDNLDAAFSRRFQTIVEFPFPGIEERRAIWEGLLPSAARVADDVDLDVLARDISMAGGSLKNIVLLAAALAVEHDEEISMKHISRATTSEFHKQSLSWPGFTEEVDRV